MNSFLFFILGFGLLIKGADFLIEGASALAKKLNISNFVIGLTVVAFGTSLPELVVTIFSNIQNHTEIGIANILGSNIANILLILGIGALIRPIVMLNKDSWKEIYLSLFAALLLGFLVNDGIFSGVGDPFLSRLDGIILFGLLFFFLRHVIKSAKEKGRHPKEVGGEMHLAKSTLYIFLGLVLLLLGGKWVVLSAIQMADILGVSQTFIGLTILALGTSLPELATVIVAVWKKHSDLAIGDIIGANILNLTWALGLTSIIKPLPFKTENNADILMIIFATLMLIVSLTVGRKNVLERKQAGILILVYIFYVVFLINNRI